MRPLRTCTKEWPNFISRSTAWTRQAIISGRRLPRAQAISFGSSGARPNWPCERLEPLEALRILDVATVPPGDAEADAAATELRGTILAALLEFSAARQHWERAEQRWRAAGTFGPAERCQRRQIELVMRGIGNVVEANCSLTPSIRSGSRVRSSWR